MDQNVIREVLYFYGAPDGWQPGSFTEALIRAFALADAMNFAKLKSAFPDYGEAVAIAKTVGADALASRLPE